MDKQYIHSLLIDIQKDNKQALSDLYDLTYIDIYKYIYSITLNKETAQDITHDVYIQVYKHIHTYNGKGHAMAWLITIARNLTYMFLRKENKTVLVDYQIDSIDNKHQTYNDSILLDMIMNEMNDIEREILVLHIIENLTFLEISHILNKNISTILSQYHRCIKRLKKKYGGAKR